MIRKVGKSNKQKQKEAKKNQKIKKQKEKKVYLYGERLFRVQERGMKKLKSTLILQAASV